MLLLRGATEARGVYAEGFVVSIHAPLARSNRGLGCLRRGLCRFNTCSSCEEQPVRTVAGISHRRFNTCSSCEEQQGFIAEGVQTIRFNTCSSCEEQRAPQYPVAIPKMFQYMLLLRGATRGGLVMRSPELFQYMLLLRGATPQESQWSTESAFQYMLLLRGATLRRNAPTTQQSRFQYMLLLRGATASVISPA